MDLDHQLCYCFHIKKRKIVNFVKQTRPRRASQISECFGAGTGCGWCIPFLRRIHRQIVAGDIVEGDDIGPAEYEALRASYRREVSAGTRPRNTHETEEPSREPGSSVSPELAVIPPRDDAGASDWDVSDYFSRPRPVEPEPDTLGKDEET